MTQFSSWLCPTWVETIIEAWRPGGIQHVNAGSAAFPMSHPVLLNAFTDQFLT